MEKRYFKNFDGLRFIAAITVALSHFEKMKQYRNVPFIYNRFFENSAQIAVTFFFVLSGFLIMWWFLEETRGNTTKINTRKFYINRVARTWPLYFIIVFFSFIFSFFNGTFPHDPMAVKRYIAYLFFLPNTADIFYGKDVYLGVTWSLAVEECFYFSFPLLLLRIRKQFIIRTLVVLTTAFLSFSIVFNPIFLRIFSSNLFLNSVNELVISFFERYRFYSFFLGAIAAAYLFYELAPANFFNDKKSGTGIGILLIVLFFLGITFSFLTQQVYSLIFAAFLYYIARNDSNLFLLNNKLVVWAGKRSYAIYMLHMFIVLRLINQGSFLLVAVKNIALSIFISWIFYLAAVLLVAHISYQLFENPIRIAVRKRLYAKKVKTEI